MRRLLALLTSVAFAVGLLFFSSYIGSTDSMSKAEAQTAQPNIVFILTDDMRADDLKYMPKTRSLIGLQGMTLARAFVPTALCCPSRATIMRGQYAHNTRVWTNVSGPSGGWQGYQSRGHEQDNVATRLNQAGYRTGLFGKYLNGYDGTTVPPGWDDWFAMVTPRYLDYDVNDNGTITHFGTSEGDYATDVLSTQTQEFIDASVGADEPFFAYVTPKAPHGPFPPVPRHEHAFDGEQAPRLSSFNEYDISDKPPWIQSLPMLTTTQIADIDKTHEKRVESLQSVDDLVEAVVNKLQSVGALDTTYIVFTSDNGWHHGEHRIPKGKARPYEEDIRVPLLVRGPGVRAGSTTDKLVLNTDFLPTFTDLAGAATPSYVDGRSLRPVLTESSTSWRTAILLEGRKGQDPEVPTDKQYNGIRTSSSKYVEYEGGFRELYPLGTDPHEEYNTYKSSSPPTSLQTRLQALKGCAKDSCLAAEGGTTANDATAPSSTHALSPQPNAAGWNHSNVTFTLSSTDTGGSGIMEIRYSATGAQDIPETVYDQQNPPVINAEGTTTISYFATDNAGNQESPAKTFTVKLDTAAPTGSVLINGGRASTRKLAVILTLSASDANSGVPSMRIANTSSALSTAGWEPFATSKAWKFSRAGSKIKTVFVQYRDGAGNLSAVVTDSIRHRERR